MEKVSGHIGLIALFILQMGLIAKRTQAAAIDHSSPTPALLSYEAAYDVRLVHASSSRGPRAATGTLESRMVETCDGWETKTHTLFNLTFNDGPSFTNENVFSSSESKTGQSYDFATLTLKNGKTVEAYKGAATLNNKGGRARYELPPPDGEEGGRVVSLALPVGTLFPAAHIRALLGRAEQGDAFFRRVVLDGSNANGPRTMSTAIGPRLADGHQNLTDVDSALLATPAWYMSSAYFNLNEKRDLPNSELFLQLHESGVIESFEQTFQDFRIAATLRHLRRLDPPDCSKN